jgi:hypothetical protein
MLLALTAAVALAAGADAPVRPATEAQAHRVAVEIMQPRWTCFDGLLARRSRWGSLRRIETTGCPELPWAILVREDRADGWQEVRRFATRRAACRARPRGLAADVRRALLGCTAPKR